MASSRTEVQTEREARTAIRAMVPDVVIVDISLAQGDGLELVRDVHAQQPELPRGRRCGEPWWRRDRPRG